MVPSIRIFKEMRISRVLRPFLQRPLPSARIYYNSSSFICLSENDNVIIGKKRINSNLLVDVSKLDW